MGLAMREGNRMERHSDSWQERVVFYLARAKEADELAQQAKDISLKGSWAEVARSWRELAAIHERQSKRNSAAPLDPFRLAD
jgi:hypothetical protein